MEFRTARFSQEEKLALVTVRSWLHRGEQRAPFDYPQLSPSTDRWKRILGIQGRLRRSPLITIGATIDTKPVKVQRIPILPRVVELANVSKRRPVRPMSLTRQPRFVSSPFGCIRIAEQRYPFVAFIHPSNVYNRIIDQLNATFVFGLTPFLALSYRERKNGKNRDDFNLEQWK